MWDGDDLVHERVRAADGTVAPLTTWVFEPGTFTPLAKIEGRKRYGVVSDHLGSPTMLATEAGKIAWRAQLDVYGVPREEEGVAQEERTTNPWRFPGQYEDAETGLYYNRFRYYDPELGRYICEDPIGLFGGIQAFTYIRNPLSELDPLGLSKLLVLGEDQMVVNQTARALRDAGYDAESMGFPRNQWKGPTELPDKMAEAVAWNREWINAKLDQGYKIVDIGLDSSRLEPSRFYAAELEEVAKRNAPTIKLKKLPSGETVGDLRKRMRGCK